MYFYGFIKLNYSSSELGDHLRFSPQLLWFYRRFSVVSVSFFTAPSHEDFANGCRNATQCTCCLYGHEVEIRQSMLKLPTG